MYNGGTILYAYTMHLRAVLTAILFFMEHIFLHQANFLYY